MSTKTFCLISILISLATYAHSAALTVGPTKIPFYTGNLSVTPFMMYWGTSKGPIDDLVTPGRIAVLKRISCFADCDYQSWSLVEQEPGKWDFGMYRKNAEALHEAGLKYVFFAWVHYPPKWYLTSPDFVPYQCVEHDRKLMQLSPWAPKFWDIYRKFYREQYKAMGDMIDWIRIATPSDYGEIGYPAGMTSWLVPQEHAHPGYWCGDPYARIEFRVEMQRRFSDIKALNRRWGTGFGAWEDVTYPDLRDDKAPQIARKSGKATDRRRWLDFIDWYYGTWLNFVPKLTKLVREFYPEIPMIVSLGYASELTVFGNDYSATPKMAKKIGIALQTPGNVAYYAQKRVSTACHFYGCPYYTEPPGDVSPEAEIARIFHDISNGVQVYFEYPYNMDRVRPQLRMYNTHMTGAKPIVDIAIFHPTTEHRLECGKGNFPINAYNLGTLGRDRFDYDVVDELLVQDGALNHYRVLVYVQGNVTEAPVLRKIASWVKGGGVLLTCDLGEVETVDGEKSVWKSLMPASGETKLVGKGMVIKIPSRPDETDELIDATERAAYHLSDYGKGFTNAPLIDGAADQVTATLLPDRILYFNGTDGEITKKLALRPDDWANREKKPEKMEFEMKLAPHSIEAVMLK